MRDLLNAARRPRCPVGITCVTTNSEPPAARAVRSSRVSSGPPRSGQVGSGPSPLRARPLQAGAVPPAAARQLTLTSCMIGHYYRAESNTKENEPAGRSPGTRSSRHFSSVAPSAPSVHAGRQRPSQRPHSVASRQPHRKTASRTSHRPPQSRAGGRCGPAPPTNRTPERPGAPRSTPEHPGAPRSARRRRAAACAPRAATEGGRPAAPAHPAAAHLRGM